MPDAPNWIIKLITPLNLFIQQTWSCLQYLTIGDNIIGQYTDLDITTPADYATGGFPTTSFLWDKKSGARSVVVVRVIPRDISEVLLTAVDINQWTQNNNNIQIQYITGLGVSKRYTIRVMVLA